MLTTSKREGEKIHPTSHVQPRPIKIAHIFGGLAPDWYAQTQLRQGLPERTKTNSASPRRVHVLPGNIIRTAPVWPITGLGAGRNWMQLANPANNLPITHLSPHSNFHTHPVGRIWRLKESSLFVASILQYSMLNSQTLRAGSLIEVDSCITHCENLTPSVGRLLAHAPLPPCVVLR